MSYEILSELQKVLLIRKKKLQEHAALKSVENLWDLNLSFNMKISKLKFCD